MLWMVDFVATTLSLIGFCILGVAGQIDGVAESDYGYIVQMDLVPTGVTLPPFAYYNPDQWYADYVAFHEEGHLVQHRSMQGWYWLVVGTISAYGYHTHQYTGIAERDADAWAVSRYGSDPFAGRR
jgi:hypothetical protein